MTFHERTFFLLTRDAKQRRGGLELVYWGTSPEGPVRVRLTDCPAVFFVERNVATRAGERRPTSLLTLDGDPVDRVAFARRGDLRTEAERLERAGTPAWEADVKPADRALFERFVTAACTARGEARMRGGVLEFVDPELTPAELTPRLSVASFDIEAEGPDAPILCVGIVSDAGGERVFVRGEGPAREGVSYHADERDTLAAFLAYIAELDPDVLIGWNVIDFDVAYLEARCAARRAALHARPRRRAREACCAGPAPNAPSVARVPGRVVLDGIATMRAATWSFESWSLEHVGQTLLGRGKKIEHDRTATGSRRSCGSTRRTFPRSSSTTSRTAGWCATSSARRTCSTSRSSASA